MVNIVSCDDHWHSGREFGTASIEIHLKSCKKKWEIEQSQKPKNERKALPQPPKIFDEVIKGKASGEQMEQYNNDAYKEYNEKVLDACPNCGRTFLSDRLVIHLKSCKGCGGAKGKSPPPNARVPMGGGAGAGSGAGGGAKAFGGKEETKGSPGPKEIKRPKTLVCYIW